LTTTLACWPGRSRPAALNASIRTLSYGLDLAQHVEPLVDGEQPVLGLVHQHRDDHLVEERLARPMMSR
jgi:hypothetical protein